MDNTERAIVNTIHINENGLENIKTIDIGELGKLGIKDIPAFLSGLLDAENDKDFSESSDDYVKGYKYGKTGTF